MEIKTREDFTDILINVKNALKSPSNTAGDTDYLLNFVEEFAPETFLVILSDYYNRMSKWGYEWEDSVQKVLTVFHPFNIDDNIYEGWLKTEKSSHMDWLKEYHNKWYEENYGN